MRSRRRRGLLRPSDELEHPGRLDHVAPGRDEIVAAAPVREGCAELASLRPRGLASLRPRAGALPARLHTPLSRHRGSGNTEPEKGSPGPGDDLRGADAV